MFHNIYIWADFIFIMEVKRGFLILGIFVLLCTVFVNASVNKSSLNVNKAGLDSMATNFDNLNCRANFTISVLNYFHSINNTGNLLKSIGKLQSDINKLKANVNNRDEFDKTLKNSFDPDLKNANSIVFNWGKNKNLTWEQKQSLEEFYNKTKSDFFVCQDNSLKNILINRLEAYESILNDSQKQIDKIRNAGIDVSSLESVITEARTQILSPLESAINAINNSEAKQFSLNNYCLFNGCKKGKNFHFQAKFELAKMQIILNVLKENQNLSSTALVGQFENNFNKAKASLNKFDGEKYSADNEKAIWDSIKVSHSKLNEVQKLRAK